MSERRAQVLQAANQLLRQYGPRKMTINDIARAAGIGVGTVYLEFPNKNEILLALSHAGHLRILNAVEAAWRRKGAVEARLIRALNARFEAFVEFARDGMHGVDLIRCGSCEAVQQAQHAFRQAEHEAFTRYLTEGAAQGVFSCDAPGKMARSVLLAYSAFSPPTVFAVKTELLRRELQGVHQVVLNGLVKR